MKKINLMTILLVLGFIGIAAQNGLAQLPNPSQQDTNEWRNKKICNDPWVSKAVAIVNASVRDAHTSNGTDGECEVAQYNGGQWGSFDQLYKAVDKRRGELNLMRISYRSFRSPTAGNFLFTLENNKIAVAALVGNDGASLVAAGGGNLVAAGGGNLIGNDSAGFKTIMQRLVAAGGGNILSDVLRNNNALPTGGGNIDAAAIIKAAGDGKLISNAPITDSSPAVYKTLAAGEKSVLVKAGNKYYRIKM